MTKVADGANSVDEQFRYYKRLRDEWLLDDRRLVRGILRVVGGFGLVLVFMLPISSSLGKPLTCSETRVTTTHAVHAHGPRIPVERDFKTSVRKTCQPGQLNGTVYIVLAVTSFALLLPEISTIAPWLKIVTPFGSVSSRKPPKPNALTPASDVTEQAVAVWLERELDLVPETVEDSIEGRVAIGRDADDESGKQNSAG